MNMDKVIYLGPPAALSAAQSVLEPRWLVVAPELSERAVDVFYGTRSTGKASIGVTSNGFAPEKDANPQTKSRT